MTGYVLKMFPRFSETFVLSEILELERRGAPLTILSLCRPDDGRFHEELAHLKSPVRYLPEHVRCAIVRTARAHVRALVRRPGRYLRAAAIAISHLPASLPGFLRGALLAEEAEAAGCSALHAHFASLPAVAALFASVLTGIPYSFTAHAKDIYVRGTSLRLLRTLLRTARTVVTVSDFNRRYLLAIAGADFDPRRLVRIYNGIDLGRFRPEEPRAPADPPLVFAVGRLVEKKGFMVLLAACALLKIRDISFRCEIAGKGPLEAELKARIDELGLASHVALVGPLTRNSVARRLARTTVLAVPCIVANDGNRDGLPTVIPEAMAAGVPVIATRVTGIPEAVDDAVTGILIEPADPDALARAIALLVSRPDLCAAMGRAALDRAARDFDLRRSVATLADAVGLRLPAASEMEAA